MQELQANTQVDVRIGPFVDVSNGYEPETGVTLGAADEAELLKHNGAATADISGRTWAAVTGCDGWYDLTLTTDDTNTEGLLEVVVQDDDVCLPVHARFMVLSQAAYKSKYDAKDAGYQDVNITRHVFCAITESLIRIRYATNLDILTLKQLEWLRCDLDDVAAVFVFRTKGPGIMIPGKKKKMRARRGTHFSYIGTEHCSIGFRFKQVSRDDEIVDLQIVCFL